MAVDDRHKSIFDSLKRSSLYQRYREALWHVTGFGLELQPQANGMPDGQDRHQNPFSALLWQNEKTPDTRLKRSARGARQTPTVAAVRTTDDGLCEAVIPVCVGQATIGFLKAGPVLLEAPSRNGFETALRQLRRSGIREDLPRLEETYFATPVVTKQQYDSVVQLMQIFAQHLDLKANQLMLDVSETDPPLVQHGKRFIQKNYHRRLWLDDVAHAVNCSRYHFSKTFSHHVGIPLTEYIARTRIEHAKGLLLNPDLRIGEVAFEVGFESLTHFNRLFKRITGYSPSVFRHERPRLDALPAPGQTPR